MARPNDPLYDIQTHFQHLGAIERVWENHTGAGVTVGIFADGVESAHPDLAANYNPALRFAHQGTVYDGEPAGTLAVLGTHMAGLVGMVGNNGIGGTGVAPGARLTGVDFLGQIQSLVPTLGPGVVLDAIRWGQNFDVMLNGWGRDPQFLPSQSLAETAAVSDRVTINNIFREISMGGRDGLGTVIVHSAGSGSSTGNANGDGLAASRFTVTVGAARDDGWTGFSENVHGANVLVGARQAPVTTDLVGARGVNQGGIASGDYIDTDYTIQFRDNASANAQVAGVVALMLQANPGLGWRDVKTILARSAQEDRDGYAEQSSMANKGLWQDMGGSHWNGGGAVHHLAAGFGMVNAHAAVRMAEIWTAMTGAAATSANEQTESRTVSTPQAIPDQASQPDAQGVFQPGQLFVPFEITQDIRTESVSVTVDVQHASARDLEFYLLAPTGAAVALLQNQGFANVIANDAMAGGWRWTFGVEAFNGIDARGTWNLAILDTAAGTTGVLNSARLDVHGAAGTTDDIYTYTRDFLTLRGLQPHRATLRDDDGGRDWINMAAITGAINASLAPGGRVLVDGAEWFTIAADSGPIENIAGGDGNDRLAGNPQANVILGGRGHDLIHGGGGNDTLHGGQGSDTIYGGSGDDVIHGGGAGTNRLFGDDGNDVIFAGQGGDFIGGGAGNDTIRGGDGADTIYGGTGNDDIGGGAGNDLIYGAAGANIIWGGLGSDTVQGGTGSDTIYGGGTGTNRLFGNDGNDLIFAGAGGDFIGGGAGNDTIRGGAGADTIYGGTGNDDLAGGAGDDIIFGSAGNNVIWGGVSNDTIHAGTGRDVMTGGPGADVFVFASAAHIGIGATRDRIADFTPGVDRIDLSALNTQFNGAAGFMGGGQASFYHFAAGGLLIGDQTGNGVADWVLELPGAGVLGAGNFIL